MSVPFPPPPIPGNEYIQPITNEAMLLEEGQMMRHCVASYARSVRENKCYIYRILKPTRATMEMAPIDICGGWGVTQMKGYRNAKVGVGVKTVVYEWLQRWVHTSSA